MYSSDELNALQIRRELQARDASLSVAIARDEKTTKAERPSMLEKATMRLILEDVTASIAGQALTTKYRGHSVETVTFAKSNVNLVQPAMLAVAAIRVMWTLTSYRGKPCSVAMLMMNLGSRFRDILEVDSAIRLHGEDEKKVKASVKDQTFTENWNCKTVARHGSIMMQGLLDAGLIEFTSAKVEGRTLPQGVVLLSEKASKIMQDFYGSDDLAGLLSLHRPVMVSKPKPWDATGEAPYLTEEMSRGVTLVRTTGLTRRKPIKLRAGVPVMQTVNHLQEVPLRINQDAMALRRFVWDSNIYIHGSTPIRNKLALPEIPEGIDDWDKNDRHDFWSDYSAKKRINHSLVSRCFPWLQTTQDANELATLGLPFYLPHNLDYRGRVYPIPRFSHHSQDSTKALFEFHNGLPLGSLGLHWLKIHVANSGDFGKISKESLQARADWCDDNREALEEMVDDWKNNRLWAEADAPFSFFVGACDLVRAWRSPDPAAYVSHIPVAVDGSNSGIQHYSGLLRAEEGQYVGLTPTDKPADLYSVVAKTCERSIRNLNTLRGKSREELIAEMSFRGEAMRDLFREVTEHEENGDKELAKALKGDIEEAKTAINACARALWELEGVTRSTVKRPVMTYGYSSSVFGFTEQIQSDYMQPLSAAVAAGEISEHPFGRERKACARFLGAEVYKATQDTLPNVSEAMKWLRTIASLCGNASIPVSYETPTGFPCMFMKKATKAITLRVKLLGIPDQDEINFRLNVAKGGAFDPAAMRSSIAPNVIHSCDGTHLSMTVNACYEAGVKDMLCIHDSFASHAGNVPLLVDTLRNTFVELYENWSPLTAIYEYAQATLPLGSEIPEPPKLGSLDLKNVLKSDYLFS